MATLGVYEEMAKKYLDKETIATEVIPDLWKLSLLSTLNHSQFKKFMGVVKELSAKVEEQHLRQLEGMKGLDDTPAPADSTGLRFFFFLLLYYCNSPSLFRYGRGYEPVPADCGQKIRCQPK